MSVMRVASISGCALTLCNAGYIPLEPGDTIGLTPTTPDNGRPGSLRVLSVSHDAGVVYAASQVRDSITAACDGDFIFNIVDGKPAIPVRLRRREQPPMHWFPYGGSPRSCPDTDGSSDYVTGNEKNVTCPACLANLAKSPTDDHATLVAYLLSAVRRADWHAVSDAANDLRVLEAKGGRP